jgi:predicted nuclease of predicted toxin-antitoxin system
VKFKVDENLPIEMAQILGAAGYDAVTVRQQRLQGYADNPLSRLCAEEERILLTLDLDFADITTYYPSRYPGFIVFRLRSQGKRHVLSVFQRLLPMLTSALPTNQLWIVQENRVRIWPGEEKGNQE